MALSTSTKSQLWSIDLIVALIIFVGAVLFFYKYSANTTNIEEDSMNDLLLEAKLLSSYLTSTGVPANWTSSDVSLAGLTDGELRIDKAKIDAFANIAAADYQRSRTLLTASHNYQLHFEDAQGNAIGIADDTFIGSNYSAADDIVAVTRLVYYNGTFVKMLVVVW